MSKDERGCVHTCVCVCVKMSRKQKTISTTISSIQFVISLIGRGEGCTWTLHLILMRQQDMVHGLYTIQPQEGGRGSVIIHVINTLSS